MSRSWANPDSFHRDHAQESSPERLRALPRYGREDRLRHRMPSRFRRLCLSRDVHHGGDHRVSDDHGTSARNGYRDRQVLQLCRAEVTYREISPSARRHFRPMRPIALYVEAPAGLG